MLIINDTYHIFYSFKKLVIYLDITHSASGWVVSGFVKRGYVLGVVFTGIRD